MVQVKNTVIMGHDVMFRITFVDNYYTSRVVILNADKSILDTIETKWHKSGNDFDTVRGNLAGMVRCAIHKYRGT